MRGVQQKLPKIMLFATAIIVMMLTMTAGTARALSLQETTNRITEPLQAVLQPVTQLLTPSSQLAPQQPASQPASPPPQAASSRTQPGTTDSVPAAAQPSTTQVTSQPVVANRSVVVEMLRAIDTAPWRMYPTSANLVNVMGYNATPPSTSGDAGWLQATENGWQLLGLQWYWWLVIVAGLAYGFRQRNKIYEMPLFKRQTIAGPKR